MPIKVITVYATAFAAAEQGGAATIETIAASPDAGLSKLGPGAYQEHAPELGAAKVIVSGGRGLGSGENFHKLLEPLAYKLGAPISRKPRCICYKSTAAAAAISGGVGMTWQST